MTWTDDMDRQTPSESPLALLDRLQRNFTATEIAIAVSVLPSSWLIAVVCGLDVRHARDDDIALSCYAGGRYYKNFTFGVPSEYERRRYPPHGDRDEWVRNGPPGHVNYPGRGGETGAAA